MKTVIVTAFIDRVTVRDLPFIQDMSAIWAMPAVLNGRFVAGIDLEKVIADFAFELRPFLAIVIVDIIVWSTANRTFN